MMKKLDLQKEFERLKVGPLSAKYINLKRAQRKIDNFSRKIVEMDLKQSDKYAFLKRAEEEKEKIKTYEEFMTNRERKYGLGHIFLAGLIGSIFSKLDSKFDGSVNYILRKLFGDETEPDADGLDSVN